MRHRVSNDTRGQNELAAGRDAIDRARRGLLGAIVAGLGAALLVAVLWLAARDAPSAGRDPNLTQPMSVPTAIATATAPPTTATASASS
jgi:hypothetical protein